MHTEIILQVPFLQHLEVQGKAGLMPDGRIAWFWSGFIKI